MECDDADHSASSSMQFDSFSADAAMAMARKSGCMTNPITLSAVLQNEISDDAEMVLIEKCHKGRRQPLNGSTIFEGYISATKVRDGDISVMSDSGSPWMKICPGDMSPSEIYSRMYAFPSKTSSDMERGQKSISISVALEQDQKLLSAQKYLSSVGGLSPDVISLLLSYLCVSYCCKIRLAVLYEPDREDLCFVNIYFPDSFDE